MLKLRGLLFWSKNMKTTPIATSETDAIKTLIDAGFLPKEVSEIGDREALQTIFTDLKSASNSTVS
jgi:hypothetical protein